MLHFSWIFRIYNFWRILKFHVYYNENMSTVKIRQKIYIQKVHKKWSILSFYDILNRCSFRKNCVRSWRFLKFCVYYRENMNENSNFKRNFLENYNDSEHAVKTKNAPFFIIFPNISFFHMIVTYWTGPLSA